MQHLRVNVLCVVAALLLADCNDATKPTADSLKVTITGLPSGAPGAVTVTGPSGYTKLLEAGQTLMGLAPGDYTVIAADVIDSSGTYGATPSSQTVHVTAGDTKAGANVAYALVTGSITITVSGVTGAVAAVTVTGPGNFKQPLTGTRTLTHLNPGTYTVWADSVRVGTSTYLPDSTPRDVMVNKGAAPAAAAVTYAAALERERVAGGFDFPLYLTSPAGDPRLFVVERTGRIRVIANGQVLATPFLDLGPRVSTNGEGGLLSVAFDPQYASNGYFFVDFVDNSGDLHVERFHVSAAPNVADASSSTLVLRLPRPALALAHYGGFIAFGPDGMLFISTGDGEEGDPNDNAQKHSSWWGKLLRIDVRGGLPYRVPTNNPFVNRAGELPEIWALGLRNPWRFAFYRDSLYIADVGQETTEEVDVVSAAQGGLNFGWSIWEGTRCSSTGERCSRPGLTPPVFEYPRHQGQCLLYCCNSITGGFVYRGSRIPGLVGTYFYSDYCSRQGELQSFRVAGGKPTEQRHWRINIEHPVSFGEDGIGELYFISPFTESGGASSGAVYRIVKR